MQASIAICVPSRETEYGRIVFVHDECANGQKIKCFAVVDELTRECYATEVKGRIRSKDVIAVLERLFSLHGRPSFLRCDNGPKFIARRIQGWISEPGVKVSYIQPGRPWQNGCAESFNSKLRDGCLEQNGFEAELKQQQ